MAEVRFEILKPQLSEGPVPPVTLLLNKVEMNKPTSHTPSPQVDPGQDRAPSSLSYRFKRSPFKELISDLSSLIFWDSRMQLVDVVA